MAKEKVEKKEKDTSFSIPIVSDDSACSMGEVKVNHSVIANIATLGAMQVEGVLGIGKRGFANGLVSFFSSKKPTSNGVNISEDEFGNYIIDICVRLKFGCELSKVASGIQQSVAEHITKMTATGVSKVNVIIDSVEIGTNEKQNSVKGES
ncbi:MAG: Asp23/Gls24 family envelope stress response protein [Puniceicoccales bacterium]|jgi:uncharacterized alkaline shock family protein YloU|nr:Asp23/Gls24 family envelope stress response protein [Puniceicoccales bacterium]